MKKLLILDVGTTSVKASLFDEKLTSLGCVIKEYTLITPQPDIVEMEPSEYWNKAVSAMKQVLSESGADPKDIISITCTTQGETLIPVDKNGNHLDRAIVWLDARAKDEADFIAKKYDKAVFYKYTGIPEVNSYCPVAKILWIKNNKPEIYKQAEKIVLLEDYLIFKLSGEFVTNPSLICTTGYFDILSNKLWDEMLDYCDIDASKIPALKPSATVVGTLQQTVADELGLTTNIKICTGAMDQVASAIGSANIREGVVTETTGTCQGVVATCNDAETEVWSPVTVYSHALGGKKYMKVIINQTAGIAYKWFRNEFCDDLLKFGEGAAFKMMDELAAEQPPLSSSVTFFPHLTGIQGIINDDNARGVFFGVGLNTKRASFIRSIMEGVGYMLRENLEIMQLNPKELVLLGGGSKSPLWCQIKSDICNIKVVTMKEEESTSLGAAILSGIACGLFDSIGVACENLKKNKEFLPQQSVHNEYEIGYRQYLRMYDCFAPLFRMNKKEA